LPCILHWNKNHFVVLYDIKKGLLTGKKRYKIADPGYGICTYDREKVKESWSAGDTKGTALFLHPTKEFFSSVFPKSNKVDLSYLLRYLLPHWRQVSWMILLLLVGTGIAIGLPILTQKLIDEGVEQKNLSITLNILLAQLALFSGNIMISATRNWIALLMGTKISIDIISDFIKKTLRLPLKYFDARLHGDFSQRIADHNRVETFLTSQSTVTLFSIVTFTAFLGILFTYDVQLLVLYVSLTMISLFWPLYWMKKRKLLDYLSFQVKGENQQSVYEIVSGVTDLKLNSLEDYKGEEGAEIQQRLFKINVRILKIEQIQVSGYEFINQFKNVLVTFLTALFVIRGQITMGMLISISYIIGQLNGLINQLIAFFRSLQDAKLSMARLTEVQAIEEEEKDGMEPLKVLDKATPLLVGKGNIHVRNLSFTHVVAEDQKVLNGLNFVICKGKITAIVGESGKTSLDEAIVEAV